MSDRPEYRYIARLVETLCFIISECNERNYNFAMDGNGGHAAGTIRLCREAAERGLSMYDPDFVMRAVSHREATDTVKPVDFNPIYLDETETERVLIAIARATDAKKLKIYIPPYEAIERMAAAGIVLTYPTRKP